MTSERRVAQYGYHVPHLIIAGVAVGTAAAIAGAAMMGCGCSATLWWVGLGMVAGGLLTVAGTLFLRWMVVQGRPLITTKMLDQIPWTGAEQVLDVGCGPGLTLIAAAKRLTSGTAVGIDKWMIIHGEHHNARAVAEENARIEGVADRVQVVDGDASAMPFANEAFDVVVSSFVFHHMPKEIRSKAMSEIARVTRPGGWILIADDLTSELAAEARGLGLTDVSSEVVLFPVHLLRARKAPGTKAR